MTKIIVTVSLLLCSAASQAGITCYGQYDSFWWWSGNKLNSSQKLTGGDNMMWNAYMVKALFTRIQYSPTSVYHDMTYPLDHHWGYFYNQFPETRVGWFKNVNGLPARWSVNESFHPAESGDECFYGFDSGSFSQPYVFDPEYMTPGLEGSYYSKFFN